MAQQLYLQLNRQTPATTERNTGRMPLAQCYRRLTFFATACADVHSSYVMGC